MRCSTVQISASAISQLDGNEVVATVPKDEIRAIRLSHDSRSRRPFLRFFSGFILVAIGLVFLTAAFLIAEGGIWYLPMKSITLGIPVIPIGLWSMVGIGLWLILGVFPGRYNLLIRTNSGWRKIFFAQSADIGEIAGFIRRAAEFGYTIDSSLLETMLLRAEQK